MLDTVQDNQTWL